MKISISLRTSGEFIVEHQGKQLDFRAIKSVEQKEFDIFKEINEYWASCGIDKQNAIFAAYEEIHSVFAEFLHLGGDLEVTDFLPQLRPKVAKLFEYHKQEDIYTWYRHHSNIGIPSGIPDAYNEAEGRPGTRDQTYDRADYERLIVLSISIRCMIPVWGEFIVRTEGVIGNDRKEYWAMTLLRESNIEHSPAMARLRRYIDAMVARAPINFSVSLKVMSIQNFNDWMLGLVAVRRLTRGDLRVGNANTNLAAFIYGFLRMKLEGMAGALGEVKPKNPISSTGDGENNLSDLEGFRIKQKVSSGDVAIPPEYLRLSMNAVLDDQPLQVITLPVGYDPLTGEPVMVELKPFIQLISPTQDISHLVKQAERQTKYLNSEIINDPQLLLCGYLINDFISISSIPHLNKSDAQRLLAFCAATMWSYKQRDLACLILNQYRTPILQEKMARPADVRSRVNKDLTEQLKLIFPFVRPGRGGKPQDAGAVFAAIDSLVEMIGDRDLHYNLPPPWAREMGVTNGAIYRAPAGIRNILADFIYRVNTVPTGQALY